MGIDSAIVLATGSSARRQGNPAVTAWPATAAGLSLEQIAASGEQWIVGNALILA